MCPARPGFHAGKAVELLGTPPRKTAGEFHTLPNPHQQSKRGALGLPCLAKGHLACSLWGWCCCSHCSSNVEEIPPAYSSLFLTGPALIDPTFETTIAAAVFSLLFYFSLRKPPDLIFYKKKMNSFHKSIEAHWFSLYPQLTTSSIDRNAYQFYKAEEETLGGQISPTEVKKIPDSQTLPLTFPVMENIQSFHVKNHLCRYFCLTQFWSRYFFFFSKVKPLRLRTSLWSMLFC